MILHYWFDVLNMEFCCGYRRLCIQSCRAHKFDSCQNKVASDILKWICSRWEFWRSIRKGDAVAIVFVVVTRITFFFDYRWIDSWYVTFIYMVIFVASQQIRQDNDALFRKSCSLPFEVNFDFDVKCVHLFTTDSESYKIHAIHITVSMIQQNQRHKTLLRKNSNCAISWT